MSVFTFSAMMAIIRTYSYFDAQGTGFDLTRLVSRGMAKLRLVETQVEDPLNKSGVSSNEGEQTARQRRPHIAHADDHPVPDLAAQLSDDAAGEQANRRSEDDRRSASERRRSARGLFELRARRDRVVEDRRQLERRHTSRFRLAFWRRLKNT